MNINFRTDMADERVDEYKQVHNLTAIDGIKVESIKHHGDIHLRIHDLIDPQMDLYGILK